MSIDVKSCLDSSVVQIVSSHWWSVILALMPGAEINVRIRDLSFGHEGYKLPVPSMRPLLKLCFDELLRRYSLPFVIRDSSGSDANATACVSL
eukprot:15335990-Ditylum_brightwellii.AAC.1